MSYPPTNESMNQGDRQQLKEVLERLERIERAILGDSEHEVWGYKQKWRHLNERMSDMEQQINVMKVEVYDKVDSLANTIAKQKGFEAAIVVVATLVGGAVGSIITLIFGGL